jgi:hypothetical protein
LPVDFTLWLSPPSIEGGLIIGRIRSRKSLSANIHWMGWNCLGFVPEVGIVFAHLFDASGAILPPAGGQQSFDGNR